MDLRRWGEFAFGLGVCMCGAAFLLLAVERLSAPVVAGAPVSVPIVAMTARPAAVAPIAPPPVRTTSRPSLGKTTIAPRRPIVAVRATASRNVVVRAQANVPRNVAAVRSVPPSLATTSPIATVRRPAGKRAPKPRMLASVDRPRRVRVAVTRNPGSERTPEPPIGYVDRPELLRSDGPAGATPTLEPVQVELTTTHLGH